MPYGTAEAEAERQLDEEQEARYRQQEIDDLANEAEQLRWEQQQLEAADNRPVVEEEPEDWN